MQPPPGRDSRRRRGDEQQQEQEAPDSHRLATTSRALHPFTTLVMAADDNGACHRHISLERRLPARRLGRHPRPRRRRRQVPAGPAHQRRSRASARVGPASPASARPRAGCRPASSSGSAADDEFLLACSAERARADAEAPVDVRAARQVQARATPAPRSCSGAWPARPPTALLGDAAAWEKRDRDGATVDPPARCRRHGAGAVRRAAGHRAAPRPRRPLSPRDLALARGAKRHRHDRGGDRRPVRAADGQLRARRRRRLPEGLLSRARRSSPAASTAARPSGAPSCSRATRVAQPRTGRVRRRRPQGEPAGTVANAAPSPEGGGSALVELRLAALGDGELRLGSGRRAGAASRRPALPGRARRRSRRLSAASRRADARALRLLPRRRRRCRRGSRARSQAMQRPPAPSASRTRRAPADSRRRRLGAADLDGDLRAAGLDPRRRRATSRPRSKPGRSRWRTSSRGLSARRARSSPPATSDAVTPRAQRARSISTWAMPASSNSGPRRTKPARS